MQILTGKLFCRKITGIHWKESVECDGNVLVEFRFWKSRPTWFSRSHFLGMNTHLRIYCIVIIRILFQLKRKYTLRNCKSSFVSEMNRIEHLYKLSTVSSIRLFAFAWANFVCTCAPDDVAHIMYHSPTCKHPPYSVGCIYTEQKRTRKKWLIIAASQYEKYMKFLRIHLEWHRYHVRVCLVWKDL